MFKYYGSMDNKEEKILLDDSSDAIAMDASYDPNYPFGENQGGFDEDFWKEVKDEKDNGGIDRVTALRIVRIRRLRENCNGDVLLDLITTKHDNYLTWCKKNATLDMFPTFVFELSQLSEVILREDFNNENPKYLLEKHVLPDGSRRNIIHLAAERNLIDIMHVLLTKVKGVASITTYPDNFYPLHYALKENHDEAAAKLIQHMSNEHVRNLFGDHDHETDDLPTFRFADVITHGNMKKTVSAILDCLMNPDWPFMPVPKEDSEEGLALPNIPFRYHFFYRLLDGDDEGLPAKKTNGQINPEFNMNNKKSCLQLLSEYSTHEDAMIRHPVVRMLMRSKWNRFGRKSVLMNCLIYLIFVIVMSVALLSISSSRDRTEYSTGLDYFRLICEIATLLFTLGFTVTEFSEAYRDKLSYFYDPFNFLDSIGLLLILVLIPLRITKSTSAEFGVSSAAYLINFLRVTKCAMAFRSMSVYVKTIYTILTKDISRFLIMWGVFLMGFTGAVFLAIKGNEENVLLQQYRNGTYWHILLQEVRSLAESSGFAETETYHAINVAISILLLVNMFFCLIVFNNILIGQIGNSYASALFDARVQYDIDRTKMVTRTESQMFCVPWCLRRAHYVDKEFLNNAVLEDDLLEDWATIKQKEEEREKRKREIKMMITNKMSSASSESE